MAARSPEIVSEESDVVVVGLIADRSLGGRLLDGGASSGFKNALGTLRVEGGVRVMEAPSSSDLESDLVRSWTGVADLRSKTHCFSKAMVAE